MNYLKILLLVVFTTVFIVACTNEVAEEPANTPGDNVAVNETPEATPDELATGRKLYKQHCANCHMEDGTGGEVEIEGRKINAEDLTTEGMKKEPDEEYIEYMVKGIPDEGMPSFKDELTDEEMKAIVKYIREEIQK